jgi:protein gp37
MAPEARLDWVITGGETDQGGAKARPSHPGWFRSLRDQCAAAGIPFHFKQWGSWSAHEAYGGVFYEADLGTLRPRVDKPEIWALPASMPPNDKGGGFIGCFDVLTHVGRRSFLTGRRLDGQFHDGKPMVTAHAA